MLVRLRLIGAALLLLFAAGSLLWGAMERQKALRAAEKASEAERARLKVEGFLAAEKRSSGHLRAQVSELKDQLSRVERATGGKPKIREVVRWKTREVEIPCYPSGDAGRNGPGGAPANRRSERTDSSPLPNPSYRDRPAGPAIHLRFEGLDTRLETKNGNWLAVGDLAIYRVSPPPEQLIDILPWQVTLHEVAGPDSRPRARWAFGPAVGAGSGGVLYGAVAESPPVRVLGLEARGVCMGLVGGDDTFVACGLAARW